MYSRNRAHHFFLGDSVLHVVSDLLAYNCQVAILLVIPFLPVGGASRQTIDVLYYGFAHVLNVPFSHREIIHKNRVQVLFDLRDI